ncbi:hypothetical protein [Dyadobacter frigoris]|uniref:Lipocalin-like domain-containing protein n=1 Tax=Dyadobacter frigoris TaxID=2576211 RepID=A0A4U6D8Z5_9BACT|nr:hypothetical protein [Dyadobacter frigoris]TKT92598.1 hypothetical protein FDK13_07185 [Dyadobacter frigoris]
MRSLIKIFLATSFLMAACEPKQPEPLQIRKVWKAITVTQNGAVVYQQGAANNARPSYSMFRLDLTLTDQVTFIDLDGRKTVGSWSLSTDNQRLILENLVPPPSESTGNIEFYITEATKDQLKLKRTTESRKTGNSINEYVLVPQ